MSVVNFNDTTPAPAAGLVNIKWQSDASGNISANALPMQFATVTSADYTVSATDTYIAATLTTANVYLPASPTNLQVLTIRNATNPAATVTVNGNGKNIFGAPTMLLYYGQSVCIYFVASSNNWGQVFITPSNWLNWTPTVTPNGSMTVSGLTINDAQLQWANAVTVNFKFNLSFTLGGTASTSVIVSAPVTLGQSGAVYFSCYSQSPGQGFPQDTFISALGPSGFSVRNLANTNLALGAYTLSSYGFYRTG